MTQCLTALAQLGLTTQDFDALAEQGYVSTEHRGPRTYYKLRFRRQRRQIVRSLGSDPILCDQVREELALLQADRQLARELTKLTQAALQQLRLAKKILEPMLGTRGFVFHGMAIRRRRIFKNKCPLQQIPETSNHGNHN